MSPKRSNAQLFTSFSFILLTVALGLWLNASPAHAVITPHPLNAKAAPASVCYIEMWDGTTDSLGDDGSSLLAPPSSACSGSLISNNRVLTAAHCIPGIQNAERTQVTCGGGSIFSSIKGYSSHPAYVNDTGSDQVTVDGVTSSADVHDVAVLDLDSPQKPGAKHYITPIVLAGTQSQTDTILANPSNCNLWGYGRTDDNNDTNSNWGTLTGANVDDYVTAAALLLNPGWTDDPQDIYIGTDTRAAPGDSGGPMVCTATDGSLVQIATTMMDETTENAPVVTYSVHEMTYFNIDWINSQIALDQLPNN